MHIRRVALSLYLILLESKVSRSQTHSHVTSLIKSCMQTGDLCELVLKTERKDRKSYCIKRENNKFKGCRSLDPFICPSKG